MYRHNINLIIWKKLSLLLFQTIQVAFNSMQGLTKNFPLLKGGTLENSLVAVLMNCIQNTLFKKS